MRYKIAAVALCLLIFASLLHNLQHLPQPWFDEGWALSLARNWVVLGHYGHLLLGEPVPSTILNTGFPAIAPIALSYQLFGIGIWQGRLPGALFMFGACVLLYHLAQRLYGRKIAVWTIAVSLIFPMHHYLHPVFVGRQALGEAPAIFYLLAGYSIMFAIWHRGGIYTLAPPLFFGLALQTKPQLLPFWIASLLVPSLWLVWQRRPAETRFLSISLILSLAFSLAISWGVRWLVDPGAVGTAASGDPYAMTRNIDILLTYVLVLDPAFRIDTVLAILGLTIGVPTIIGAAYVGFNQMSHIWRNRAVDVHSIWTLILWTFVVTWLGWFFLLSIGFVRYLFPAVLVGSIFTAKAFSEIMLGFDFGAIIRRLAKNLHERRLGLRSIGLLAVTVLFFFWSITTVSLSYKLLFSNPVDAYSQVLTFLNNETPPTAVIEAYDSELFLFLERDYHYPPDRIQHILNRNHAFGENRPLDYDPISADINYLVAGLTGQWWSLYDPWLAGDEFHLVYQNGNYQVYRYAPALP
jgi:4-amino-4-deoxy-L-arabinose transferase-like glycosyltransferase